MPNIVRNTVAIMIALILLSVPAIIIRVSYEISLVGAGPAIEQLRGDMTRADVAASEDVIGQATAWNQKIRSLQAFNSRWWADPFIPDTWDTIPFLEISRFSVPKVSQNAGLNE